MFDVMTPGSVMAKETRRTFVGAEEVSASTEYENRSRGVFASPFLLSDLLSSCCGRVYVVDEERKFQGHLRCCKRILRIFLRHLREGEIQWWLDTS